MGKVVEEAWTLNSADIVAFGVLAGTGGPGRYEGVVGDRWEDIWCYQVPTGTALILKPSHRFSVYLDDNAAAETAAGIGRLRIEVKDQSLGDSKIIFGPALYETCKEFQDRNKMATLDLQSDMSIEERMWIVISCYIVGQYHDEDESHFKLETVRIRSGL